MVNAELLSGNMEIGSPEALMEALRNESSAPLRRVIKAKGATTIEGLTLGGEFRDEDDD